MLKTSLAPQLYLIRRIHDVLQDSTIEPAPVGRFIILPKEYDTLTRELDEYMVIHSHGRFAATRFEAFENAGFLPYWQGRELYMKTPKGNLRIR